jgi:hypothetical protein
MKKYKLKYELKKNLPFLHDQLVWIKKKMK